MEFKFLRHIPSDIRQGRNLELYLTVLVCLVVFVLGISGTVDPTWVTSAILAVLSLEAMSLLENRRTEQELQYSLEKILERDKQPNLSQVIVPYYEKKQERLEHLKHADEVWILSRTCRMFWLDYQDELQTAAQRGGLKLLFIDPSDGALDMVTKSAIWRQPNDGTMLKADVKHFINRLKLVKESLKLDKFKVRLINYLPAWSLILINPRRNDGIIYVEFATYRSHPGKHPGFVVKCGLDNDLFDQFRDEFEQMWNDAKPAWEPDDS